jgi:hypothetical protein
VELKRHLSIVSYAAILLVFVLEGCATTPVTEVSESTGQEAVPSSGRTLDFPTKRFSIGSPPVNWKIVTEKYPPSVAAWQSSSTQSIIQIHTLPASTISHRGLAESIMHVLKVSLREKDPQTVITVAEEKEVIYNDKTFYRIIADCDMSPMKGVQVKWKFLYYLLKEKKMDYGIALIAVLAYYEQDKLVIDQMVRSFACF